MSAALAAKTDISVHNQDAYLSSVYVVTRLATASTFTALVAELQAAGLGDTYFLRKFKETFNKELEAQQ